MKITYTDNPLKSVVELEPHEQEALRLKIIISGLEERMENAIMALERDPPKIEEAIKELNSPILESYSIGQLHKCLEWLKEPHAGDCISYPISCVKCYAESRAGIDTIKGLNKSQGSMLHMAFAGHNDINKAFTYLENPEINRNDPRWRSYSDEACLKHNTVRKTIANEVIAWLLKYKNTNLYK